MTLSWWGWGRADAALDDAACADLARQRIRPFLPMDGALTPIPAGPPPLPAPRLSPEGSAGRPAGVPVADDPLSRAGHAYGKAYRDVVRALAGDLPNPPDLVLYPRSEAEIS